MRRERSSPFTLSTTHAAALARRTAEGPPPRARLIRALAVGAALACGTVAAYADEPAETVTSTRGHGAERVADDSPRVSLSQFLDLCREGDYALAAQYLYLPDDDVARGAVLARRLKLVLDEHVWFDLDKISSAPEGNLDDGLPEGTDEVGQIPGPRSAAEPVRLVRRQGEDTRWVFSRSTVGRIDTWFARLDRSWLLERLPAPLLRPGPANLLYWQWLGLPLVLALSWVLGLVLSQLSRRVLLRITRGTATTWDDEVVKRLSAPLTIGWALAAVYVLSPWLGLYRPAHEALNQWLRAGALLVFFWVLSRSVDVGQQVIAKSTWSKEHTASRSLLPLSARVIKVLVVVFAFVSLLSELGYPVASIVAGLGIGGLAFALAAQKTVENLFGAFSIGADQPFREGDFVKVEDFVGTVEAIGLRSTRIRTLDRTIISLPNGKLADMRLETFAARDRIRLACTLGLVYSTTAEQMRTVLAGLEKALRDHPKIWPDAVVVRFKEFGASSLDVEIMAWFQTSDFGEFQRIRQEVLLDFMGVVEGAGSSFAFPTRTIHMVSEAEPNA